MSKSAWWFGVANGVNRSVLLRQKRLSVAFLRSTEKNREFFGWAGGGTWIEMGEMQ